MSDALSTLRTALAPKGGMKRIPFPLETYQTESPPLSAKRLVNLYPEQAPNDARTVGALISTPGLTLYREIGTGPIRAMNGDLPGLIYVASGSGFYRMQFDGAPDSPHITYLGEIGTPAAALPWNAQAVTIAVGVAAVVVCVPPNAFTCSHSDLAVNQLGGTFPGGAASVCYLDGYFVFTSTLDQSQFFICGLLDPTAFDALDFAHADGTPNVIGRVISHRGDLWLMGTAAIEIWYNSGDRDFPFRRRQGGVIPRTLGGPTSVATGDGSVFWVGVDGIAYRSNGYQAERISTHSVENALRFSEGGYAPLGLVYRQVGHEFYSLTAGTTTVVYDCATKAWHNRSSSLDGSTPWRIGATAWIADTPLLGDLRSGKLFTANLAIGTEDGADVIRQATLPTIWADTNRAFLNRLEIEMEVGGRVPTGDLTLEWSNDGGWSWPGGPRTLNAGETGHTYTRVYTTRLGSFHQRSFRVTGQRRMTLYGVAADISAPGAGG